MTSAALSLRTVPIPGRRFTSQRILVDEASPVAAGFDSAIWAPSVLDSATRSYREGAALADNVSAVYEAPELAARSAEGFPRPFTIDTSHGLPWQGAKRRRVNPACYPMLVSPVPGYPSSWRHHADERHQRVHEPSIDLQWNQRFLRLDGSSSPFTGGLSFPARLSIWRAFFSLARDARSLK